MRSVRDYVDGDGFLPPAPAVPADAFPLVRSFFVRARCSLRWRRARCQAASIQVLRQARLVDTRKAGTRVFYRLAGDEVTRLLLALQEVARVRLAEVGEVVRTHLSDPEGLEPVGREELLDRAARGDVVVLDVRPTEEYRAGHIPGALSIPVDELEARLGELPDGAEIVAYCRGPYCVFARDAVTILRARGRAARRLADGLPEWRLAGLPVAAGQD